MSLDLVYSLYSVMRILYTLVFTRQDEPEEYYSSEYTTFGKTQGSTAVSWSFNGVCCISHRLSRMIMLWPPEVLPRVPPELTLTML